MARVPLPWRNLTSDLNKFLLSVLGIGFAVMLLFVQLGFYNALMDSSVRLIEKLNADLIIIHKGREYVSFPQRFPRSVLARLRSVPGVGSVHALTMDVTMTRLLHPDRAPGAGHGPNSGPAPGERVIRVIGVDPDAEILDLPELARTGPLSQVAKLRIPGQAIFDRKSREEYGLSDRYQQTGGEPFATELAGRRIQLVGTFTLGPDFQADGNLIVSEPTFRAYLRTPFPFLDPDFIDLGLVRVERRAGRPVVPIAEVQARLTKELDGTSLKVISRAGLVRQEQDFWETSTPIGQVFWVGLVMGGVVGVIICYQILSSGVADRLAEYATLRAIGYSNRYLAGVVIQEALILGVLGFLPGWVAAYLVYQGLESNTGLPLRFTPYRVFFVFMASLVMCAIAALIAVREAQRVDPAEVF